MRYKSHCFLTIHVYLSLFKTQKGLAIAAQACFLLQPIVVMCKLLKHIGTEVKQPKRTPMVGKDTGKKTHIKQTLPWVIHVIVCVDASKHTELTGVNDSCL